MLVWHVSCLMVVFVTSELYKILRLDCWYSANEGVWTLLEGSQPSVTVMQLYDFITFHLPS